MCVGWNSTHLMTSVAVVEERSDKVTAVSELFCAATES